LIVIVSACYLELNNFNIQNFYIGVVYLQPCKMSLIDDDSNGVVVQSM